MEADSDDAKGISTRDEPALRALQPRHKNSHREKTSSCSSVEHSKGLNGYQINMEAIMAVCKAKASLVTGPNLLLFFCSTIPGHLQRAILES